MEAREESENWLMICVQRMWRVRSVGVSKLVESDLMRSIWRRGGASELGDWGLRRRWRVESVLAARGRAA